MESLLLEKIGLLSNNISRDDLKPGDHIYSWRNAYIYAHHGIYTGDGKVIHFTRGGGLEIGTGTILDKMIVSSVPNHGGDNNPCPNCGQQSNLGGIVSSCLDCFLAGGELYLFDYGVSPAIFMTKLRGGVCTTATSDPSDQVISRAKSLLTRNGFGDYHVFENNCEDFAIYCKTSLVVGKSYVLGRSGQANSVSAAACVARMLSPWASNAIRLFSDIGMRNDAVKVPVESLVARQS
uniref:LRAT domain-containing protein n=1 Tax=Noccaea caerulescens TaxID=107243 RepID=A0A1J3H9Q5_NOCCA